MAKSKWFDPLGLYAKEDEEIAQRELSQETSRKDLSKIAEIFRPTEADLTRVYTDEELRRLCLVKKAIVCMDWFNPVETFMDRWRREGRIARWSPALLTRMLNKAIKKNDDYMKKNFSQKAFEDEREFFRRERVLDNNLYLDAWHSRKEEASQQIESNETTERDITELSDDSDMTISDCFDSDVEDQQSAETLEKETIPPSADTVVQHSKRPIENSMRNKSDDILTESFFETDTSYETQSQPVQNSEDLRYEMFGTQIPLTSTQSQSQH